MELGRRTRPYLPRRTDVPLWHRSDLATIVCRLRWFSASARHITHDNKLTVRTRPLNHFSEMMMPNPMLDQDRLTLLSRRVSNRNVVVPAWPRANKELRQVELEVEWVRFSVRNHRTKAEQMQKIARLGQEDLFMADPLGTAAQNAQFDILASQDGFAELKADLKARRQQEPAIVTAEGVLINCNRRSAALRSLYRNDSHLPARYVECLVLPEDATAAELVDLEAELQVARDFKQDYSWINEALLIQELYEREHRSFDNVAQRMHRRVEDVRSLHEKLQQVTQLVALSGGTRHHIDFTSNESAFDELAKHIRNKPAPEAEVVRTVYFLGTLANVNYRQLRHLKRSDAAEMVWREIQGDPALAPLLEAASVRSSAPLASDDPLDDAVGSTLPTTDLNGILGFLAEKRPEETIDLGGVQTTVRDLLSSVQGSMQAAAADAEAEAGERVAVTAPLNRSRNAVRDLQRALVDLPRARLLPGWDEVAFEREIILAEAAVAAIRATT